MRTETNTANGVILQQLERHVGVGSGRSVIPFVVLGPQLGDGKLWQYYHTS